MGPRREGEQMDSYPGDFPFGIMDVVELLHLRIRRRQANSVYVDCPFCGDRRGKMNVNFVKNVWRCNYCDEHGGMLALYARLNNTTTSDAYWEIGEALCNDFHRERPNSGYEMAGNQQAGTGSPVSGTQTDLAGYERRGELKTVQQAERASGQEIHQTLSLLLAMLPLQPAHRNHLHSPKRGLSDEQIDRIGFKSTPPPFLCRSITERLMKQGCKVEGVPGFYLDDSGRWTMNFYRKNAGILIPAVGYDGMIHGLQILLDSPLKQKDDPPDKSGAKYIWFSSSSKNMGVTSGSPVHFIGNPSARVVYVIEGLLKADISHCLTNRTFAAIAGANNTSQLDTLFALLAQNGTEEIIEAHDMDKYSNQMTSNGASKIYLMARKNGMACRQLTWNPNYKGFDDWQLALREKEQKEKEVQRMNFKQQYLCGKCDFTYIDGCVELWHTRAEKDLDLTEYLGLTKEEYQIFLAQGNRALKDILDSQRVFRRFCIYQLCLSETQTVPFAFKRLDALHKAGYEQPPAAAYQTVWSAEVCCPKGQNDMEVLGRLFLDFNEHLPEDYRGRPLAPSDVVELDCQGKPAGKVEENAPNMELPVPSREVTLDSSPKQDDVSEQPTASVFQSDEPEELPVAPVVQQEAPDQPMAPSYTESTPVEDILKVMTFEEAQNVVVDSGLSKGKTMATVAKERPVSLKFYLTPGNKSTNNIVRAAAQIMLDGMAAQKAG